MWDVAIPCLFLIYFFFRPPYSPRLGRTFPSVNPCTEIHVILSRQLWYLNENRKMFLTKVHVTDDKRYGKIYCKRSKRDSIKLFESALREEMQKLEHKMRIGFSTLRKLAEKLRFRRKVFNRDSSILIIFPHYLPDIGICFGCMVILELNLLIIHCWTLLKLILNHFSPMIYRLQIIAFKFVFSFVKFLARPWD